MNHRYGCFPGYLVVGHSEYDHFDLLKAGILRPGEETDESLALAFRTWTIAEVSRMVELDLDLICDIGRMILWEGRFWRTWGPSDETAGVQGRFLRQLRERIDGTEWKVREFGALPLREGFLAFPDFVVLKGRDASDRDAWPSATDHALVVEVADHLYRGSKAFKLPEYDRAGVPATWVVDVVNRQVAVHRRGGYDRPEVFSEGDTIALPFGGPEFARIAVSELFRPEEPTP